MEFSASKPAYPDKPLKTGQPMNFRICWFLRLTPSCRSCYPIKNLCFHSKPRKISARRFRTSCRAQWAVKILECAGNQRATALFPAKRQDYQSGVALPPSADKSLATALQSTANERVYSAAFTASQTRVYLSLFFPRSRMTSLFAIHGVSP